MRRRRARAAQREAIRQELSRLEESAMWSAQGQLEQARRWRILNFLLGIPGTALAAVAGTAALLTATGRAWAGALALAAAVFSAVLTL